MDLIFTPDTTVNGFTVSPARTMRVYASRAFPGALSFFLKDVNAGLRLNRDQAVLLHKELGAFLEA